MITRLHNSKVAVCVDGVFSVVDRPACKFVWKFLGGIPSSDVKWSGWFHRLSDSEVIDVECYLVTLDRVRSYSLKCGFGSEIRVRSTRLDSVFESGSFEVNQFSQDRSLDDFS